MKQFYETPTIETAVRLLRPNASFSISDQYGFEYWEDPTGEEPPEFDEIQAKLKVIFKVWEWNKYQRDRTDGYGCICDQLDMLYKDIKSGNLENGEWVNHIDSVKKEFPKPTGTKPPSVM